MASHDLRGLVHQDRIAGDPTVAQEQGPSLPQVLAGIDSGGEIPEETVRRIDGNMATVLRIDELKRSSTVVGSV